MFGEMVASVEHLGPVSSRPATVKWRQLSKSNRQSTIGTRQTEYHEALPSSANDEARCDCKFTDDGNASWYSVCRVPMVEWRLDCENCRPPWYRSQVLPRRDDMWNNRWHVQTPPPPLPKKKKKTNKKQKQLDTSEEFKKVFTASTTSMTFFTGTLTIGLHCWIRLHCYLGFFSRHRFARLRSVCNRWSCQAIVKKVHGLQVLTLSLVNRLMLSKMAARWLLNWGRDDSEPRTGQYRMHIYYHWSYWHSQRRHICRTFRFWTAQ